MFGLLCGAYAAWTEKPEYKVLLIGLDRAGKTTFLEQAKKVYKSSYQPIRYPKYMPTIGLNIGRIDAPEKKLLLWDLGGQQNLRQIWNKYYKEANALIFMIDGTSSTEKLQEAQECYREALSNMKNQPVVIVVNKTDQEDLVSAEIVKEMFDFAGEESDELARQRLHFISSISGDGVADVIGWLTEIL